jgi:hypothetical protein
MVDLLGWRMVLRVAVPRNYGGGRLSPKHVRTIPMASRAPGSPPASRSNSRTALSTAPG